MAQAKTLSDSCKVWEEGAYKTANEGLYALMQDCRKLYGDLTNAKDANLLHKKQGLNDYLAINGLGVYKDKPLPQKIIVCVFGNRDRRRISTYTVALRRIISEGWAVEDVPAKIAECGGVQEMSLGRKPGTLTAKGKADLVKSTVQGIELVKIKNAQTDQYVNEQKHGETFAAVLTQNTDGSFSVNCIVDSKGAVNAALTANTTLVDDVAIANDLLAATTQANADLFEHLYPDFYQCVANQTLKQVFDAVDVDMVSIQNYIKWLRDDAKLISASKRNHYLIQAQIILSVAKDKGGKYYQRKKPSDFGRLYYVGTSVQNVNKELRRAMLGNCWEYDIRSSVVAWKMGYAQEFLDATNPTANARSAFRWTLSYLENKTGFMNAVQYVVFGNTSELADELQVKILKQAFTALSFGARKTGTAWMDTNGGWIKPAIVDIIQVKEERERFLADVSVCGFIAEQNMLDTFLFDTFKEVRPDLLKLPYLQTQSGKPSKAKVIAFMYQHEETTVMDIVRRAVIEHGKTVLANIHDAIIVKQRLGADLKQEVEMRMQEKTANPYWRLGVKELRRFESDNKEAKLEEATHKQRMQQLEAKAVGYESPFISSNSNP